MPFTTAPRSRCTAGVRMISVSAPSRSTWRTSFAVISGFAGEVISTRKAFGPTMAAETSLSFASSVSIPSVSASLYVSAGMESAKEMDFVGDFDFVGVLVCGSTRFSSTTSGVTVMVRRCSGSGWNCGWTISCSGVLVRM